jgi:hypothetical protein
MIAWMDFRNYLVLSRRADLDISFSVGYEYYPMDTQDDGFFVYPPDEGFAALLSSDIELTPFLKARVYDDFKYRTDYVDTRGRKDYYGGEEYERIENTVGVDFDWLAAKDQNLGLSLSRHDELPQEDGSEDQERTSYNEGILYEKQVNARLMAGVRADYGQNSYVVTNRSDSYSQQYSAYTEMELTRRSKVGGSIGYTLGSISDPDPGEEDEYNTGIGGVWIESELSKTLKHGLALARTMDVGYDSAFETADTVNYHLDWAGRFSTAGFYSRFADAQTSDDYLDTTDYTDWINGLTFTYPLLRYMTLVADTSYSIRDNAETDDPVGLDLTEVDDYDTWVSQIGTAIAITRNIEFTPYVQHTERYSDNPELEYTRNLFSAMFTYSHQF